MIAVVIALLLLACGGPSDVTIVRDVQIIHVGAEPTELLPGEETTLTVTVADPLGEGVQILAWPCTDLGEGCAEDLGQATSEWVSVLDPVDEDASLTLAASTLWTQALTSDAGGLPFEPYLGVWFLACRPGLCSQLDLALGQPAIGSDDDKALRAFLHDPTAAMADLPLDGSSLGQRRVPVSGASVEDRNQNPELRLEEDRDLSLVVDGEEALTIGLIDETPGLLQLDGFTTIGRLGPSRTDFYDPVFTWFAGEEAGSGRIYIVLRDSAGGSALMRKDATVAE